MLVVGEGVDEKCRHIYMLKWQQKWCGLRRGQKSVEGGPRIQNNGERGLLWGGKNKEKDICTWDSGYVSCAHETLCLFWSRSDHLQSGGRDEVDAGGELWRSRIASERSCKGSPEKSCMENSLWRRTDQGLYLSCTISTWGTVLASWEWLSMGRDFFWVIKMF